MPDDPRDTLGDEDDLVDLWLAHRETEGAAAGHLRSSTVPPKWAPPVIAPRPEVEAEPEPVPEPLAMSETELVAVEVHPADPVEPASVEPEPVEPESVEPEPVDHGSDADADTEADDTDAEDTYADAPAPAALPAAATDDPPVRLTFRPRTRARTAVGLGTLLAAAASVLGCYVAARERDMASVGIAVTLWVLTAIIWAVYAGTSVTRLSVRGGQLQVVRQGVRTTIDLTSSYTPVEVHGRPGKHGWKVVFRRRDLSTFTIDQSMVDPAEFMRVLRYYRPGIDAGHAPR